LSASGIKALYTAQYGELRLYLPFWEKVNSGQLPQQIYFHWQFLHGDLPNTFNPLGRIKFPAFMVFITSLSSIEPIGFAKVI